MALVDLHIKAAMISALRDRGEWKGQRRGIHISLKLAPQADLAGRRIRWVAYLTGHYDLRSKGIAGTVFEALAQIEKAIHR